MSSGLFSKRGIVALGATAVIFAACGGQAPQEPQGLAASGGKADATGQFCGGIAGLQCPDGYDCELDGRYPDAGGKCRKKGATGQFCGGIAGLQCPAGFVCELDGRYPDAGGKCRKEQLTCAQAGGTCKSSPTDVTFPADCEADFGEETVDASCAAINQVCCKPAPLPENAECQPSNDRCDAGLRCCQTCCGIVPFDGLPRSEYTCVTDPGDGSPCPLPM